MLLQLALITNFINTISNHLIFISSSLFLNFNSFCWSLKCSTLHSSICSWFLIASSFCYTMLYRCSDDYSWRRLLRLFLKDFNLKLLPELCTLEDYLLATTSMDESTKVWRHGISLLFGKIYSIGVISWLALSLSWSSITCFFNTSTCSFFCSLIALITSLRV